MEQAEDTVEMLVTRNHELVDELVKRNERIIRLQEKVLRLTSELADKGGDSVE